MCAEIFNFPTGEKITSQKDERNLLWNTGKLELLRAYLVQNVDRVNAVDGAVQQQPLEKIRADAQTGVTVRDTFATSTLADWERDLPYYLALFVYVQEQGIIGVEV